MLALAPLLLLNVVTQGRMGVVDDASPLLWEEIFAAYLLVFCMIVALLRLMGFLSSENTHAEGEHIITAAAATKAPTPSRVPLKTVPALRFQPNIARS